ncbi:MAG: hypothetical protein ACRCUY_04985 [Thermoguttaceae bacterium]
MNGYFFGLFIGIIVTLSAGCVSTIFADGLTPKSPEVIASVGRAADFLRKNGQSESRIGGKALISLALIKAGVPLDEPFIQATLQEIKTAIASDGTVQLSDPIYSASLIVFLLAEIDPSKYQHELHSLARFLEKHQRTDGAWTYLNAGNADAHPSGDMSMTQYAVMALWTLKKNGIKVSDDSISRVSKWLAAAQNSEGGFAYQTTMSPDYKQVSWDGVRLSMSAAGMASVYVCRDMLGYNNQNYSLSESEILPSAFKEVISEEEKKSPLMASVPKGAFQTLQNRGDLWLERRFFPISTNDSYYYYYLYAVERFAAFREIAENKYHESPPWYDQTATLLLTSQNENGSWQGNLGAPIDTAYSVLFLLRSTQRTVEKIALPNRLSGGNLLGGHGLPKETDALILKDGKVLSPSELARESLLNQLQNLENFSDDTLQQSAELSAEETTRIFNKNKAKMEQLVGDAEPKKRLAAVQMFAKTGDVKNAPLLIYALTDPDPFVAEAADAGLRRLARQTENRIFPRGNSPEEMKKREALIQEWKEWYLKFDVSEKFL